MFMLDFCETTCANLLKGVSLHFRSNACMGVGRIFSRGEGGALGDFSKLFLSGGGLNW